MSRGGGFSSGRKERDPQDAHATQRFRWRVYDLYQASRSWRAVRCIDTVCWREIRLDRPIGVA